MPPRRSASSSAVPAAKRPRSNASSSIVVVSRETKATRRLQRVWRSSFSTSLTRSLAADFLRPTVGVSLEHVRSISFEALVVHLRAPHIIDITRRFLQRVHLMCTFLHGSPPAQVAPETVNARVFLAGYMIAFRPSHVFEAMTPLAQSLFEVTVPLVTNFEAIARSIVASGSFQSVDRALTEGFTALLFNYLRCFRAWKVPDEARLTCRIRHALIALYQAEAHLPADEAPDSRLRTEFTAQIARLRLKLRQIGGAEALERFDAERGTIALARFDDFAGPATTAAFQARMTNEHLAHELLLDQAFQLGGDEEEGACLYSNPVFRRIRASFHQAFWDSLVDDLSITNPCYVRVSRVLVEVRDGLIDLSGQRDAGAIREIIDPEFIQEQASRGSYDWATAVRLIGAIVGVIQRIQAPCRDADTAAKWAAVQASLGPLVPPAEQPAAFCKALEFLLKRVNVMRIDAANARLRLIAPVIREHGIEYEQAKFNDKLNNGVLTLVRTEACIDSAVARELAANTVALEDLAAGQAQAFALVHTSALVSLFAGLADVAEAVVPETLLFDVHRLAIAQVEFRRIVDGATVLVSARHAILAATGPLQAKRDAVNSLATSLVAIQGPGDYETVRTDLCRGLDTAGVSVDRAQLVAAFATGLDPADSVRQLIAERVRRALVSRLLAPAADPQLSAAFPPFVPRIDALGGSLGRLLTVNRTVHAPTYNRLIAEAAAARVAGGGVVGAVVA